MYASLLLGGVHMGVSKLSWQHIHDPAKELLRKIVQRSIY